MHCYLSLNIFERLQDPIIIQRNSEINVANIETLIIVYAVCQTMNRSAIGYEISREQVNRFSLRIKPPNELKDATSEPTINVQRCQ